MPRLSWVLGFVWVFDVSISIWGLGFHAVFQVLILVYVGGVGLDNSTAEQDIGHRAVFLRSC